MLFSEVIPLLEKLLKFPLFPVKDTIITIASLLALVVFMVGFIILARVLNHVLRTKIQAKTRLDEGISYALGRITQYLGFPFHNEICTFARPSRCRISLAG